MGTTDRVQVRIQGVPYSDEDGLLTGTRIELQARVMRADGVPVTEWTNLPAKYMKVECNASGIAEATVKVRVHSMVDVEAALTGVELDLVKP